MFWTGQEFDSGTKKTFINKGRWITAGSETNYIEIGDWIQGNHLQCVATSKEDKAGYSISYFSYSESENAYIYFGLYGSGSIRTLRGQWADDKFIFEGQR